MLRLVLFFCNISICLLAIAQVKCSPFSLNVIVPNDSKIEKLYLNYRLNSGVYILDSAKVKKGKAIFNGCIKNPLLSELHVKNPNRFSESSFSFFIDSGHTTIIISKDFPKDPVFLGSKTSTVWREYQKIEASHKAKLMLQYKFTEDELNDSDTAYYYRLLTQRDFISKNSKSFASLELFRFHLGLRGKTMKFFSQLQENYKQFDSEILESEPGKKVTETMKKIQLISNAAILPDFALKLSDSSIFKSNEFEGMILIDFWASWCLPCIVDFPFLQKLSNQIPRDKLLILSISIDEDVREWRNAIEKYKLNDWLHALAQDKANINQVSKLFYQPVVPIKMLLGRDRRILGWWRGSDTKYEVEILKLINSN